MRRSVVLAKAVAAVFVVIALVALTVRPLHFERTAGVGIGGALLAGAYLFVRSRPP